MQLLQSNNIRISMTSEGDPGENALAERIKRTMKEEFNCWAFPSFDLAMAAITKSILAYNQLRPHASCDYLTPAQAHQQDGPLKKRWRKYEKKNHGNTNQLSNHVNRTLTS